MNEFKKVNKATKRRAVEAGIIRRVVAMTGKHKSGVSRTLWGKVDRPDPAVAAALRSILAELSK